MKLVVTIISTAQKSIGEVEASTKEEFIEKAYELWKAQDFEHPTVNISNDFDLNDWDIDTSEWDFIEENMNGSDEETKK